jgi:FAD/FMN-containing dehydrogenase/Fe-S oxidoreductase
MSLAELPVVRERVPLDPLVLQNSLKRVFSGDVRFDRITRALYSTDASVYQIVPLGVVLPKTEEDILATIKTCAQYRVPITARGGGTSQAGQAIGSGVQIDCSKYFNEILEINAAEQWVRVRPGCVLDELNRELKPLGLQFAPDISTSNRATIGGMIANNSSGTRSIIYGKTGDHILELRVALSNGDVLNIGPLDDAGLEAKCAQQDREGEIYRTLRRLTVEHAEEIDRRYPRILRRVGGYDLASYVLRAQPLGAATRPPDDTSEWQVSAEHCADLGLILPDELLAPPTAPPPGPPPAFTLAHLLVGSEGTLALTLEAKLRLVKLPAARTVLVAQFADLLDALAAAPAALEHNPSAVEVIDRHILDSTRMNPEASRLREFLHEDPGAILIIELCADATEELEPRLLRLEEDLIVRGHGTFFYRAVEAADQARVWKLRKLALGLSMAEKGDAKAISFVEDTAVAPDRLRDYIAEFLEVIARHGTRAGIYAHASVGCLHVRPVVDLKTEAGVNQFEAIASDVADLVLKYGGALSGEHGDGLVRSPFQERMYGPALYQAFREIKRTFDPENLLNPGKIVDAPPLKSNLRYGPGYFTPELPTTFDFAADGGLTRAAELCAGVGECRKKLEGTMCPSYQATRDEQHCTRGRANALRLAMTGQLGRQGFTDPMLMEVMELCLECKACKAECPTNTDMARLKAEFLHQYYQKHGLPRRNRLFGQIAKLSAWGCRLAPFSNLIARSGAMRWFNEKLFGIDARRLPPRFAWKPLHRTVRTKTGDPERRVLFFPDTFAEYYEPRVGQAALDLLQSAGCAVTFGSPAGKLGCCGRPMISNGMLTEARTLAEHNVDLLFPWAEQGRPIVACEPSCLLTIKDDYPALVRDDHRPRAMIVAQMCMTLEECLEAELVNAAEPPFRAGPKQILVQGHCHQQALVGMAPILNLLRRIPDVEVIDLDAGCCGMAGSFGYEKEHYELSRQVGEGRLFPAIRKAAKDAVVVAPGFSCRMQIEHFTGRKAVHPAQLLRSLIANSRG